MRIGVDIDGVLADFNTSFIERMIEVTGKDLFPERPFDIPTWNYPEHFGYDHAETSRVWETIKTDGCFWKNLSGYNNWLGATFGAMGYLADRIRIHGDDVYFITARVGPTAKEQSEIWLDRYDPSLRAFRKTVLISSHKGLVAMALDFDVYIDDRWENAVDVREKMSNTQVFLMDRPWNRPQGEYEGIQRVTSVVGICD